jgi:phage gp36-like protein
MTYCTKQDLINAFGEQEMIDLTDRSGSAVMDDAVLDGAIAKADAEVNMWIAGNYTLPLTSVPPLLMHIACDVVRYVLSPDILPEHHAAIRYKDAVGKLKEIAKGRADPGLLPDGTPTTRVDLVQVSLGRNDFSDRGRW